MIREAEEVIPSAQFVPSTKSLQVEYAVGKYDIYWLGKERIWIYFLFTNKLSIVKELLLLLVGS